MTTEAKPRDFWLFKETAILCENRIINIHDQHNFIHLTEFSALVEALEEIARLNECVEFEKSVVRERESLNALHLRTLKTLENENDSFKDALREISMCKSRSGVPSQEAKIARAALGET